MSSFQEYLEATGTAVNLDLIDKAIKLLQKSKIHSKEILSWYKENINSKAKIFGLSIDDFSKGLELTIDIGQGNGNDDKILPKEKGNKLEEYANDKKWKSMGIDLGFGSGNALKMVIEGK